MKKLFSSTNQPDRLRRRNQVGSNNHGSKIDESTVASVKGMFEKGAPQWLIARANNITPQNTWCVLRGKSWKHVAPNLNVAIPDITEVITTKVCPMCELEKPLDQFPPHKRNRLGCNSYCRTCKTTKGREDQRMLRTKTIAKLGGKCNCCGETEPRFLALDHINNDGASERRKHKNLTALIYRGERDGSIQLLCHNCNAAKGFYGKCPHQQARELEMALAE